MSENNAKVADWLARVPELNKGKNPGMDPAAAAKLCDEILAAGEAGVVALIDTLNETDDGRDWKTRLLLRTLVSQVGAPDRAADRAKLEAACALQLIGDRPSAVKTFLAMQLQYFAGPKSITALTVPLTAPDPALIDAVAAALVAVGPAAEPSLRFALDTADGHTRTAIEHALTQIKRAAPVG